MYFCKPLLLAGLFFLLSACATEKPDSGIDLSQMDKSVSASTDFYRHVNGLWLDKFEIPADKSNYGSFTKLADEAEENIRAIIEESASDKSKVSGSAAQKIGDLYQSYMDTTRIEALGIAPLQQDISRIGKITNRDELAGLLGEFELMNISKPFGIFINQDARRTTEYILHITQSGLGLPDRDYYFNTGERFEETRAKYHAYITRLFTLAGDADAQAKALRIVEMETAVAEKHWTRVANRDRDRTYNKFAFTDLEGTIPAFNWKQYAAGARLPRVDSVIVRQPDYLEAFGDIFVSYTVEDWKTYLKYKLLHSAAPYLGSNFENAQFDFYGRVISGREAQSERWKRGVRNVNNILGELVGQVYVERHFKPEAKERMDKLVANLMVAFEEGINGLDWMSPATKERALEKLAKFTTKIGYPDKWKDYSGLTIDPQDLLGNMKRSALSDNLRELDKIGKPIDRTEWFMSPQIVNAYYNPPMNEVVFPAAILQPPFFNLSADDAVNYGAIGAVIGHEISHGFDDQGRKSDGDGVLRDWWSESDASEFKTRANIMVEQYNQFSPLDSMTVNGSLTLGENIADLGGLTIAFKAYQHSLGGKKAPVIDGYSGEQRFFLGYAQIWRRKYREEELRNRLVTDPHSPSQYRVNGILANMPEFYAAFDVKEGDGMYRSEETRVKIW